MQLRPYQAQAVQAAQDWMRSSIDPCLIEAPTGAGKSHIVSALAEWLHGISGGKRVLCLAPQKELVLQNAAKMKSTGTPCSVFSASAGMKSTRHKIVFATPLTVKNSISRFRDGYCAIVLDEAHTLTPTVLAIIEAMRAENPNLRVVGLTATPFRLGSGYIFRLWPDGRVNSDDTCRDPFFVKMVYRIEAQELIDAGYLTRPLIGSVNAESYDTTGLELMPNGRFSDKSVDMAFVGHGRKTAGIVGDVVKQAANRMGVVFFAATVRHAEEIMASLPPSLSAIVTGETPNRASILQKFDRMELKYLVNVGVLTTGWDCAHVDVIALLRRTESVGLLQQMIGRGLRLHDQKSNCLILDYAENLETHTPDGDLFAPRIKAGKAAGEGSGIEALCPDCGHTNDFKLNPDYADYQRDQNGYCLDVFGERLQSEFGPIPAHYGRRCWGMIQTGPAGQYERCGYRWAGKPCGQCNEPNDISARYCYACGAEIVDPNEKLIADFKALKRDPTRAQTDEVISVKFSEGISAKGNKTVRADWKTYYRHFSSWHLPTATHSQGMRDWAMFDAATNGGTEAPKTVTYIKDANTGFFRVLAYNREADKEPA